jgi:hypothetical protein
MPDAAPAATGPETYQRSTMVPPTLTLDLGQRRIYAVEVATDPGLFANPAARTPQSFFASWMNGKGLTRADDQVTTFAIPTPAWLQLRAAEALYFRVLTSTSETAWVETLNSGSSTGRHWPRIVLHGQFTHGLEQPFRDEELLWRRDPGV